MLDRGVKVMGIDAIGFDPPVAKMFERRKFWEAHRVMREREYYHLENLCNLHEIPAPYHSFIVSVLPVKWRGASAAPGPRGRDRRRTHSVKRDAGGSRTAFLEDRMIVLTAKYFVKAGRGDEVEAALRRMAPLVKAGEPGCTLYHANRAAENPRPVPALRALHRSGRARGAPQHAALQGDHRGHHRAAARQAGAGAVSAGRHVAGRT